MPSDHRLPNWFLRDSDQEYGPLAESEIRARLSATSPTELEKIQVRQGTSAWYSGAVVLQRFKDLSDNGIYLRSDDLTTGPFTAARALEILATTPDSDTLFRIGRSGNWFPANQFIQRVSAAHTSTSADDDEPIMPAQLISLGNTNADSAAAMPVGRPISPPMGTPLGRPVGVPIAAPVIPIASPVVPMATPVGLPPLASPRSQLTHYPTATPQPIRSTRSAAPVSTHSPPYSRATFFALLATIAFLLLIVASLAGYLLFVKPSDTATNTADTTSLDDGNASSQNSSSLTPPRLSAGGRQTAANPPVVTAGTLFRPTFNTFDGPVAAGTAFAARLPGSSTPIILSALHLLGPAGGLPNDIPASELTHAWRSLEVDDCVTSQTVGLIAGRPLPLLSTAPFPQQSQQGDVVAYLPNERGTFQTLPLASSPPAPNDVVWLVSQVIGSNAIVHKAKVLGEEDGWLVYQFESNSLELRATSGAPVVNSAHQVVAVNAGGGTDGGVVMGLGTPVTKFLAPLTAALGAQ
jgi:hypothetical protein